MNIASIDIGTNTVLLLIANYDEDSKNLKPILNEYRMPRIGRGLLPGESIPDNSKIILFKVLSEYKDIVEKYNCSKVLLTGTNALRIATNTDEILGEIKSKFNFNVNVISGEEEANFAFLGSAGGLEDNIPKLVIDIGGGSTELIFGEKNKINYSKSFPFGAVSVTEKYFKQNEINNDTIKTLREEIQNIIEELNKVLPSGIKAIAVAGTPTSLSCIKQNLKEYDDSKVEKSKLQLKFIEKMVEIFSANTPIEILNKYGSVVKGREDIILAGTIILAEICSTLKLDEVHVSSRGIRYGAIINYLKTEY